MTAASTPVWRPHYLPPRPAGDDLSFGSCPWARLRHASPRCTTGAAGMPALRRAEASAEGEARQKSCESDQRHDQPEIHHLVLFACGMPVSHTHPETKRAKAKPCSASRRKT